MKFVLERSTSPIYDRIVLRLAQGLEACGNSCMLIDPRTIQSRAALLEAYNPGDWIIITNSSGLLSQKVGAEYLFEVVEPGLVFLHHDSPVNTPNREAIEEKLLAWLRIRQRSLHFSIEATDVADLNAMGLTCHPIRHLNTLGDLPSAPKQEPLRSLAFLGHAVPSIQAPLVFGTELDFHYFKSYLSRIVQVEHPVKGDFPAPEDLAGAPITPRLLSHKLLYLQYANVYTLFQRGALLERLAEHTVDLYGGDPAWIHGMEQSRFFPSPQVVHHPPMFDPTEVIELFRTTRVNLNISALQFDHAVVNRVLDCAAAGGFLLTDKKAVLSELTGLAEEISYASPAELQEKVRYFLDPAHDPQRREIAWQLREDLQASCGLEKTLQYMLGKMHDFSRPGRE